MISANAASHTSPLGILARCVLVLALCLAFVPLFSARSVAATSWNMEKSGDSYVITIATEPRFGSEYWHSETMNITYADGTMNESNAINIIVDNDGSVMLSNSWWSPISGATVYANEDDTQYRIVVPASFFANEEFTISYAGKSEKGAGKPAPPVEPETPEEPEDPIETPPGEGEGDGDGEEEEEIETVIPGLAPVGEYGGIKIDGSFDDWNAVQKYEIDDGNSWNTVDQVAMVWDGDYVYLYFMAAGENGAGNWNSVAFSGPNTNGKFAITTDLGKTLPIQLAVEGNEPVVRGVNGASASVNNTEWFGAPHMWEVAIPASAMPEYNETISFGFYLSDPTIKDVGNLQGEGPKGSFEGVVYDGHYDDWAYYPHTTIQYATPGTQEDVVDAEGALYIEGSDFYAHTTTSMPEHLAMGGTEFTQGVTIRVNGSDQYLFSLKFGPVGPDGGPVYNADGSPVIYSEAELRDIMAGNGTYEFCVFSLDAGHTHDGQINDTNQCYGKMFVTLDDAQADMEWKLDLDLLSKHLRSNLDSPVNPLEPTDIKTIEVQWGRLGDQWVATAGTPTGSLPFLASCGTIAIAGAYMGLRRRKVDVPQDPVQTEK